MTQNRKYLIIALGLLTILALVLFVISKDGLEESEIVGKTAIDAYLGCR